MGCDFHYKCQTNGNVIAWIFILHLLSLWLFFPKKNRNFGELCVDEKVPRGTNDVFTSK